MSGIIHRVFGKEKTDGTEMQNGDAMAMRSASRKAAYKTWLCGVCKHESFYKLLRCILCGSERIKSVINPVSGIVAFERAKINYVVLVAANGQHILKHETR